jgi:anti-sigma factor RsiW
MNKCTNSEIQDLLPDLEHGKLATAVRQGVEAHLAGCDSCREELRVIRAVKSAAVFEPSIDAESIVRQIPPYRMPVPAKEMPARNRLVEWLVAAAVAVLLVGGGALLQKREPTRNVATIDTAAVEQSPLPGVVLPPTPTAASVPAARHTPALSLAADVHELSDGNLRQLMDEMENFDALPNSEPEPVFAVDMNEGR